MVKKYFKKCDKNTTSIVDGLKQVGVKNPDLKYREKIGKLNGIKDVGQAIANKKMLDLLKSGKLIKEKVKTNEDKYVDKLNEIHKFIKQHGKKFIYSWSASQPTFKKAKEKIRQGKKVGTTCVVPTRWALDMMGIDPSGFYGKDGHFTKYSDKMKKYLKKITKGSGVGCTLKEAVDKKLLKKGDILTFKDCTHTATYTGNKYNAFDGGTAAEDKGYDKVGIIVDYSTSKWKNKKINEILRWKV